MRERTNRMRERDAGEGEEIGRHKRWEKRETGHRTGTPMSNNCPPPAKHPLLQHTQPTGCETRRTPGPLTLHPSDAGREPPWQPVISEFPPSALRGAFSGPGAAYLLLPPSPCSTEALFFLCRLFCDGVLGSSSGSSL